MERKDRKSLKNTDKIEDIGERIYSDLKSTFRQFCEDLLKPFLEFHLDEVIGVGSGTITLISCYQMIDICHLLSVTMCMLLAF